LSGQIYLPAHPNSNLQSANVQTAFNFSSKISQKILLHPCFWADNQEIHKKFTENSQFRLPPSDSPKIAVLNPYRNSIYKIHRKFTEKIALFLLFFRNVLEKSLKLLR